MGFRLRVDGVGHCRSQKMVPKNDGPVFEVPIITIMIYWGLLFGPRIVGNPPFKGSGLGDFRLLRVEGRRGYEPDARWNRGSPVTT